MENLSVWEMLHMHVLIYDKPNHISMHYGIVGNHFIYTTKSKYVSSRMCKRSPKITATLLKNYRHCLLQWRI